MGEVEAESLRADQGAGLLDVIAQDETQGGVEEVGSGVVGRNVEPVVRVHHKLDGISGLETAFFHFQRVDPQLVVVLGCPGYPGIKAEGLLWPHAGRAHIALLSPGGGVEGGLVRDQLALLALFQPLHFPAVLNQGDDLGLNSLFLNLLIL